MARDWRLYAQDILALERSFEVIGEAAKNLPADVRELHSAVPWRNIIGMRDILAHGYFSVSPAVLWDTMSNDLGILQSAIEAMLASSGEKES